MPSALDLARQVGSGRQFVLSDVSATHSVSNDGATVWVALLVGKLQMGEEVYVKPNMDAHITLSYGRPSVFPHLDKSMEALSKQLERVNTRVSRVPFGY
ncbi:MAG: hypothetical protein GY772_21110 [bacterium]|nr:hypothetical protein [bacterium]